MDCFCFVFENFVIFSSLFLDKNSVGTIYSAIFGGLIVTCLLSILIYRVQRRNRQAGRAVIIRNLNEINNYNNSNNNIDIENSNNDNINNNDNVGLQPPSSPPQAHQQQAPPPPPHSPIHNQFYPPKNDTINRNNEGQPQSLVPNQPNTYNDNNYSNNNYDLPPPMYPNENNNNNNNLNSFMPPPPYNPSS